jgi:hypothetical protein
MGSGRQCGALSIKVSIASMAESGGSSSPCSRPSNRELQASCIALNALSNDLVSLASPAMATTLYFTVGLLSPVYSRWTFEEIIEDVVELIELTSHGQRRTFYICEIAEMGPSLARTISANRYLLIEEPWCYSFLSVAALNHCLYIYTFAPALPF